MRHPGRCPAGLVLVLWGLCFALPAAAAPASDPPSPAPAVGAAAASHALALAPPRSEASGEVSLTFANTNLHSAFSLLADLARLSVVFEPGLTGEVSVSLHEVKVTEAIAIVARAAGVTATVSGNVLLVGGRAPEAEPPAAAVAETEVRVYSLQYADPGTVVEMAPVVAPALQIAGEDAAKRLVARGSAADLAEFELFLAEFDRAGRQVLIEARVEEVSRQGMKELGLRWDMPSFSTLWDAKTGSLPVAVDNLAATLDALETGGKARLLARPTITTISGEKATIFVGDRVPVVLKGGEQGAERIEYIEAGITLEIVARIGADGLMTTHVKPQVSSIVDWTPQGLPQVRSRNAETTVRVRDGQPIIIGGLIREEDRQTMARIPGIGALPIVGSLFRSDRSDITQFETVIILTPRLISDAAAPALPGATPPGEDSSVPTSSRAAGRFTLALGGDLLAPTPGRAELAIGWQGADCASRWEVRVTSPLPTSLPGQWRWGLAWRAEERPVFLRMGTYGVVESTKPLAPPAWEMELALGLYATGRAGIYVEPSARVVWAKDATASFSVPATQASVVVGARL